MREKEGGGEEADEEQKLCFIVSNMLPYSESARRSMET